MKPEASPADCPGQTEDSPRVGWRRVDDYRSDIDFESQEMIGGVVYDVMGSDYPHARRNGHLDYLLQGLAAPGYGIASDLKTRVDEEDDFATSFRRQKCAPVSSKAQKEKSTDIGRNLT